MIASAFDDRDRSRIADCEPLTGHAAEIALTGYGAVQNGIADNDRPLRHDSGIGGRSHYDSAAGKPFAKIVVGVALKFERHTAGEKGAEALAGGAGKARHDRVRLQAFVSVTFGDFAGEHGAGGAIGILDRKGHAHRLAALERGLRLRDQLTIEYVADFVILPLAIENGDARRHVWLHE